MVTGGTSGPSSSTVTDKSHAAILERKRERDRQTDRQTDRQADRQAGRQAGRQTGRQTKIKKEQLVSVDIQLWFGGLAK